MTTSAGAESETPSSRRVNRWVRVAIVIVAAAGALAVPGDWAFHHFWPFQPLRDELGRVGAPLEGATLAGESTSGFPYGCLDQCPSVSASWRIRRGATLGSASNEVTSRLVSQGYQLDAYGGLECWSAPGEGVVASVGCTMTFRRPGFVYGVRFDVPMSALPTVSPQQGSTSDRVSVPAAAPIVGLQSWVDNG